MHQFFIIHEKDKGRGTDGLLGNIVNLQAPSIAGRRLEIRSCIMQNVIQDARRHTFACLCPNLIHHIQHSVYALTRFG